MRHVLLAGVAAVAFVAAVTPVQAQVSADQVRQQVAQNYEVDVLRINEGELDGKAVWLVTVMNSGGNFNDAFQVNTLAIDKASGELVPSYRNSGNEQRLPPVIAGAANSTESGAPLNKPARR